MATGRLARFGGRIFSAEDVSRGKPARDLFLHAARAYGASPARCVAIEDSAAGVEAANAAGMTGAGFARVSMSSRSMSTWAKRRGPARSGGSPRRRWHRVQS